MIQLSAQRLNFLFEDDVKNAVIITICLFFDLWLNIFVPISIIYIMAVFIHFIEEFKYLNKELTLSIRSTAVYKSSDLFSKWKKTHAQTSLVVSYFNSNMKVYINNTTFVACIGIMAVLYNTTVSCHGMSGAVLWISKYGILLFGVMLPSISVNNQVTTFEIFYLYFLLLLNSGFRFRFDRKMPLEYFKFKTWIKVRIPNLPLVFHNCLRPKIRCRKNSNKSTGAVRGPYKVARHFHG